MKHEVNKSDVRSNAEITSINTRSILKTVSVRPPPGIAPGNSSVNYNNVLPKVRCPPGFEDAHKTTDVPLNINNDHVSCGENPSSTFKPENKARLLQLAERSSVAHRSIVKERTMPVVLKSLGWSSALFSRKD